MEARWARVAADCGGVNGGGRGLFLFSPGMMESGALLRVAIRWCSLVRAELEKKPYLDGGSSAGTGRFREVRGPGSNVKEATHAPVHLLQEHQLARREYFGLSRSKATGFSPPANRRAPHHHLRAEDAIAAPLDALFPAVARHPLSL